ncbi:DgyrCDS9698 [Dimorphilus gyrociliatus]|uniref:DgyrCDS9698 n=1 Tax=Dimorphilus gyrociliatus TaxID=2664684 RepID=A0A7I8VZ52_9ANNE|nr:DgyrCDS9698 [Dimorphilus gyrociliatus]
MERNPLLLYHQNILWQTLKDDDEFCNYIIQQNTTDEDGEKKRLKNDFEYLFNNFILFQPTDRIISLLSEISESKYTDLIIRLQNTWKSLIEERREFVLEEISNIQKSPFLKRGKMNKSFLDYIIPIQIISRSKSNVYSSEGLTIDLINHLNGMNNDQSILFGGEAGIGKTYHCLKLLNLWATNYNIFSNYLVILVKMDEISDDEDFLDILLRQNFSPNSKVTKQLLNYYLNDLQDNRRRNIVFFFDENDNTNRNRNRILDIKATNLHKKFAMISWSRYWRMEDLGKEYDHIFEITGFSFYHMTLFVLRFCINPDYFDDNQPERCISDENLIHFSNKNLLYFDANLNLKTDNKKAISLERNISVLINSMHHICYNPLNALLLLFTWKNMDKWNNCPKLKIFKSLFNNMKDHIYTFKGNFDFDGVMMECCRKAFNNYFYGTPMELSDLLESCQNVADLLIPYVENGKKLFKFYHSLFRDYFVVEYINLCLEKDRVMEEKEEKINMIFNELSKPDNSLKVANIQPFLQHSEIETNEIILKYSIESTTRSETKLNLRRRESEDTDYITCKFRMIDYKSIDKFHIQDRDVSVVDIRNISKRLGKSTVITTVSSIYCSLNSEHFMQMGHMFSMNSPLEKLDFSGNEFDEESSKYLFNCISENLTKLKVLILNHCDSQLSNDGLCRLLKKSKHLSQLELLNNELNESADFSFMETILMMKSMKTLKLPNINTYQIEHLKKKAETLKTEIHVTSLYLGKNELDDRIIRNFVEKMINSSQSINTIGVNGQKVNFNDYVYLFDILKVIKKIDFSDGDHDRENMERLLKLNYLQKYPDLELDVSECKLDQMMLCYLFKYDNITVLNVSDNNFKGILKWDYSIVLNMPKLQKLYMNNCNLDSNFLSWFTRNLYRFQSLFDLDLSSNPFENDAALEFFEKIAKEKNKIKILTFYGPNLDIEILLDLVILIKENTTLMSLNSPTDNLNYNFNNIKSVLDSRDFNLELADMIYFEFFRLKRFKTLIIGRQKFVQPNQYFTIANYFKQLEITDIVISNEALEYLDVTDRSGIIKRSPNIQTFTVQSTYIRESFAQDFFSVMESVSTLKSISLIKSPIQEEYLEAAGSLIGRQKDLKHLNITGRIILNLFDTNLFQHISPLCCNIEQIFLDCSECCLNDTDKHLAQFLGRQTRLNKLCLSYTDIDGVSIANIFKHIPSPSFNLTELSVPNYELSRQNRQDFGAFIACQTQLNYLDLSGITCTEMPINIDDSMFPDNPEFCCNISKLYLDKVHFSNNLSEDIGRLIQRQKNLNTLSLSSAKFEEESGRNLFQCILESCCTVEHLDLLNIAYKEDMNEHLGKFIDNQTRLQKLFYSNSSWESHKKSDIFQYILPRYSNIRELKLDISNFSNSLHENMAIVIGCQTKLASLHLMNGDMENRFGNLLNSIPNVCNNIEEIVFRKCKLDESCLRAIQKFIGFQKILRKLDISDCSLENYSKDKALLKEIILSCSHLQQIVFDNIFEGIDLSSDLKSLNGFMCLGVQFY